MNWCRFLDHEYSLFNATENYLILKKKLYGPYLWMGFNCLKDV